MLFIAQRWPLFFKIFLSGSFRRNDREFPHHMPGVTASLTGKTKSTVYLVFLQIKRRFKNKMKLFWNLDASCTLKSRLEIITHVSCGKWDVNFPSKCVNKHVFTYSFVTHVHSLFSISLPCDISVWYMSKNTPLCISVTR